MIQSATVTAGAKAEFARQRMVRVIRPYLTDDRGEGVISMAIAILIVATIGAVMFGLLRTTGTGLNDDINRQINEIGN